MKTLSWILFFCLSMIGCAKNDSPSNVENVINLDEPARPLSAKYRYEAITAYAATIGTSYRLDCVSSADMTTEGLSNNWMYQFRGTIDTVTFMQQRCYMRACNDSVQLDSVITKKMTVGDAIISQKWVNSDIAMKIAEKNGGSQFRSEHAGCTISGAVGEVVGPNPCPMWSITYTVNKNVYWSIRINAATGAVEKTITPGGL